MDTTTAEREIARQLAADPLNFCNAVIDQTVDVYMGPIANAVLRGDLGDAAMASLGRELLQQYLRDTKDATCREQEELEELIEQTDHARRAFLRNLPAHLRPRV